MRGKWSVSPIKEDTVRWFGYAKEDLRSAEMLLSGKWIPFRNVCYLSQQAVEKAIKAVYVASNVAFVKTHNLDALKNQLTGYWKFKTKFPDLSALNVWAVESRYPGDWEEAIEADARNAYELAVTVIETIEVDLKQKSLID
jgi:HEPN domain-containing protein